MSEQTTTGSETAAPELSHVPSADENAVPLDENAAAPSTAEPDLDDDEGEDDASEAARKLGRKKGRLSQRITELTTAKRETEADRDHWRETAMRLVQQANGHAAQQPPDARGQNAPAAVAPTADALPPDLARAVGPAPDPAAFLAGEFDLGYYRAVAAHDRKVEDAQRIVAQRQQAAARATQEATQNFARALAEVEKTHPDIRDVIGQLSRSVADPVANLIAEAGPEVAYAIGKDAAVVERFRKATTLAAVAREIGRVEARLEAAKSAPPAVTTPKASAAPPPPPATVRGSGTALFDPAKASPEDYVAWRNAGGGL